jgi:D-sedoheptulose 7-phosphate isomerase
MIDIIKKEFQDRQEIVDKFLGGDALIRIAEAASEISICLSNDHKVLACGNGGSMSDAMHFVGELVGKYREERPAYAAMALSDQGTITCISNDFGYNQVFKRQIEAVGREGDVLLALSTSGNSQNVITAAEYAKRVGMHVIAITGTGGTLRDYADILIEIPHSGSADRIQELTIVVLHIIVLLVENELR